MAQDEPFATQSNAIQHSACPLGTCGVLHLSAARIFRRLEKFLS